MASFVANSRTKCHLPYREHHDSRGSPHTTRHIICLTAHRWLVSTEELAHLSLLRYSNCCNREEHITDHSCSSARVVRGRGLLECFVNSGDKLMENEYGPMHAFQHMWDLDCCMAKQTCSRHNADCENIPPTLFLLNCECVYILARLQRGWSKLCFPCRFWTVTKMEHSSTSLQLDMPYHWTGSWPKTDMHNISWRVPSNRIPCCAKANIVFLCTEKESIVKLSRRKRYLPGFCIKVA